MQIEDMERTRLEPPWRRRRPKRTPKQRLRLTIGLMVGLYVLNVAANVLYKKASQEQVDLLRHRMQSLARLDSSDPALARMAALVEKSDYASFTEAAPFAIAKRMDVTAYLKRNPHLTLGIAVDGEEYTSERVAGMLRDLNRNLRPYRLSIGLAGPAIRIEIPSQATREDILLGITTAFQRQPDYVIALTANRCGYAAARSNPREPLTNRVYTFGWMGLSVVDGADIGDELALRLQTELANFLRRGTRERRWQEDDYAQRPGDILANHQIVGRWRRFPFGNGVPTAEPRSVHVSIGLDGVSALEGRAAIEAANEVFRPMGIRFVIQRQHVHRLRDFWKWPLEMKKMLGRGGSDIYLLLTASQWASPDRGPVRGLANATVGAAMIQLGTRAETTRRLVHELGHLFGLPHTLLRGHVMYPNEGGIGLRWSPGSRKLLAKNKESIRWFSSITSPERFEIAIKLAPMMRRSATVSGVQRSEAFASANVWVSCAAK